MSMLGYVFFDIEDATIVVRRDQILRVAKRVNSSDWVCLDIERVGANKVVVEIAKLSQETADLAQRMRNDLVGPDFPIWTYADNKEVLANVRWRLKDGEWSSLTLPAP